VSSGREAVRDMHVPSWRLHHRWKEMSVLTSSGSKLLPYLGKEKSVLTSSSRVQ